MNMALVFIILAADGGAEGQPLSGEPGLAPQVWIGASMDVDDGCSLVVAVVSDGPADRGGLRPGDCVTQIGDHKTGRPDDVLEVLQVFRAGASMVLTTKTGSHKLVLENRPSDAERQLCRALTVRRTRILVQGPAKRQLPDFVDMAPPATFASLRRLIKATEPWAVVTLKPDCEHLESAPTIIKQPAAGLVLTEGSYVMFFVKRPVDGRPLLLSP